MELLEDSQGQIQATLYEIQSIYVRHLTISLCIDYVKFLFHSTSHLYVFKHIQSHSFTNLYKFRNDTSYRVDYVLPLIPDAVLVQQYSSCLHMQY